MLLHERIDAFIARQAPAFLKSIQIRLIGEGSTRFRLDK